MKEAYRNGLAEVDEILKFADEESLKKIPEKFKEFIKENKSNYIAKIDPKKNLDEQDLLYETKVILSVLYRDYWSSEEERKQLIEKDKIELQKIENEKQEKYSYDNLFKKKQVEVEKSYDNEIKSLVVQESLFKKILNKIKRFFRLG
ncbi:MAG: hypothetical protein FWF46_04795 [Oscillospiraceae bacterium]|nr:hypothetical protein [Oscillospiraceae bacterium]